MDYREHLAKALVHVGTTEDFHASCLELLHACGSCIAFIASRMSTIEATNDLLDHIEQATRAEAVDWFARNSQEGAPHGKPH